jgi:hypothetical protein
MQPS